MPPLLPAQLNVFSTEVIPILQRRGLFRTEYNGTMLREHYGLPWPASVFDDPAWRAELRESVAVFDTIFSRAARWLQRSGRSSSKQRDRRRARGLGVVRLACTM